MRNRVSFAWVLLLLVGCSSAEEPSLTATTATTAGSGGAGGSIGEGGSGCAINVADMIVESDDGVATRLHVPIEHEGTDAALFFDTGSALSFFALGVDGPRYVPHAGDVALGCDTVPMAGRAFDSFGMTGALELVGILGADYLLGGVSEIDTAGAKLVRRAGALPPEQRAWPLQSYEDIQGHIITGVTLDGRAVRLMFDTGAPHILWLGEEGQPGDQTVTTTDAVGNVLTLYLGEVALEMVGEPAETVPVLRAPSFPYFEQTVKALGGNIHGLLGLSALRGRNLVVDPDGATLRLAP
jgi:hypothetical protein